MSETEQELPPIDPRWKDALDGTHPQLRLGRRRFKAPTVVLVVVSEPVGL